MPDEGAIRFELLDKGASILQRDGAALSSRAARLKDSVRAIYFSKAERTERQQLQRDADKYAEALLAYDARVIHEHTVICSQAYISAEIVGIRLQLRAQILEALWRYLREVTRALNDTAMRALTRAILYVSAVVLVVTAATLCVAVYPPH